MIYKYDIAFSYASEQKALVKELSDRLMKLGIPLFADYLEPERFWGNFLPEEIRKVYYEESRVILIFLSKEYRDKVYTSFEGRIAAEKGLRDNKYLIIKIDNVDLPWLNTAQGFINWNDYSVEEISGMLLKKLGKKENNQNHSLFQSIQKLIVEEIKRINTFLDYTPMYHDDKDNFYFELLSNEKIIIRFSLNVKERINSTCYQVLLTKYPQNNDNELNNGEFFPRVNGEYTFYNYGFFRKYFYPVITFKNREDLEDAIITELIACGESLYE